MTDTFNQTYFDFDEEIERLDEAIAKIDEQLEATDNEQVTQALSSRRSDLQSHRQGVVWARDYAAESDDFPMWDEAVDGVTLGALRAGTFGRIENDADDGDAGHGTMRVLYVADGTVEAPYVDEDMSDAERVSAVRKLHPMYLRYAEDRIDALMSPGGIDDEGEGNGTDSEPSPEASQSETQTTD